MRSPKPKQAKAKWPKNPYGSESFHRRQYYPSKHSFSPKDPVLLKKIGIKEKDRVYYFAGFEGSWAKAIASFGPEVTFTDISKHYVEKAKESGFRYQRVLRKEAGRYPRKPLRYDWSFSFEPFPVLRDNPLMPVMRGLLNKKGLKFVVFGKGWKKPIKHYLNSKIFPLCNLYGAKLVFSETKTKGKTPGSAEKNASLMIVTVHSNNNARQKAWLDLLVRKRIRFLKMKSVDKAVLEALLKDSWLKKQLLNSGVSEQSIQSQINASFSRLLELQKTDPFIFER